jgi:Rieske Fe-S protein
MTDSPRLDRRALLGCAALCGAAAPVLVACSSDRADEGATTGDAPSSPTEDQGGGGGEQAAGLVAAADVPVGGGVVLADQEIVVVQPEEGAFRGYTAVCTHQGCLVQDVSGGTINCPCHGSAFAVADGSVANGPATNPLSEVQVRVRGGQVVRA